MPAQPLEHETALETEVAGELLGELTGDRDQHEVAFEQFWVDRALLGETEEVVFVMDEPPQRHPRGLSRRGGGR